MIKRDKKRHVVADNLVVFLQRLECQRQVIENLMPQLRSIYKCANSK